MPVIPTYPGVYVEEIPSGVRTIAGVSTSVTAFVGYTRRGPLNTPVRLSDFGAFERTFGGLDRRSVLSYGLQQFFLNGGADAVIVRVAAGAAPAAIILRDERGNPALTIQARSPGAFGNNLRAAVDYATTNPDSTFNLELFEYEDGPDGRPRVARSEIFRNLSMDEGSSQYAVRTVNAASALVTLTRDASLTFDQAAWSRSRDPYIRRDDTGSPIADLPELTETQLAIMIVVDDEPARELRIIGPGGIPADLAALVTGINTAIAGSTALNGRVEALTANASGGVTGDRFYLLLRSTGTDFESSRVRVLDAPTNNAARALGLGITYGGREREGAAQGRPAPTATTSGDLADLARRGFNPLPVPPDAGADLQALRPDDLTETMTLTIRNPVGPTTLATATFALSGADLPITDAGALDLVALAARLQGAIRAQAPAAPNDEQRAMLESVEVHVDGTRLRVTASVSEPHAQLIFTDGSGNIADMLELLDAGGGGPGDATHNVQLYALGIGPTAGYQTAVTPPGSDGDPPGGELIIGNFAEKSGFHALEDTEIFNLLCIPDTARTDNPLTDPQRGAVISAAIAYCQRKRAFMVVDPPPGLNDIDAVLAWKAGLDPSSYAALYFPSVDVPDPLDEFRLRAMPPSGTVAGVIARIDANRGVFKAPAGTEANLVNVQGFGYRVTDAENGRLNPQAVNALRSLPGFGRVVWGARTLRGADQRADEYKYIPVRRLALFIEESLYRGLHWVVFEPNDEPLWAQIRLNGGAFMNNLFRQGAFQGTSPREAYFVRCDKTTTPQNAIDLGIVNILVGFAPLKPAEFVIIQIQQKAGTIQT